MADLDSQGALERLKEGNARFVAGNLQDVGQEASQEELLKGQSPYAVVLSCADSRVIPEQIFDCGAGELFVIRVAGNVAGATQMASIEFAVEALGARLTVVLGHSHCGAIKGTLLKTVNPEAALPKTFPDLFSEIAPSLNGKIELSSEQEIEGHLDEAVNTHAEATARRIADYDGFAVMVESAELQVVAAHYSLENRQVTFL